jgi:hypothetical protein
VPADLSLFMVEMYSPGEIVDARRSFRAQNIEAALADAKPWVKDSRHSATSFRVVDSDGATLFDRLVTDFA